MADALTRNSSHLVLMYIPQKAELYWPYLSRDGKQKIADALEQDGSDISVDAINANLAVQRDALAGLTSELGVEFLDLTAALGEAIAAGKQPYFFSDTHWNQVGHDTVRITLLDFLNQFNLGM